MVHESKSQFDLINILNILISNPKYFHSRKKNILFLHLSTKYSHIYIFFSYLRNIDVICNTNLWKKKNRPVFFFSFECLAFAWEERKVRERIDQSRFARPEHGRNMSHVSLIFPWKSQNKNEIKLSSNKTNNLQIIINCKKYHAQSLSQN